MLIKKSISKLFLSLLCLSVFINSLGLAIANQEYTLDEITNKIDCEVTHYEHNNSYFVSPISSQNLLKNISLINARLTPYTEYGANASFLDKNDSKYFAFNQKFIKDSYNQSIHRISGLIQNQTQYEMSPCVSEQPYYFYDNFSIKTPINTDISIPIPENLSEGVFYSEITSFSPRYRNVSTFSASNINIEGNPSSVGFLESKENFNITIQSITETPYLELSFNVPSHVLLNQSYFFMRYSSTVVNKFINISGQSILCNTGIVALPFSSIIDCVRVSFPNWDLNEKINVLECYMLYPENFIKNMNIESLQITNNNNPCTFNNTKLELNLNLSKINWDVSVGAKYQLVYQLSKNSISNSFQGNYLILPKQNASLRIEYFEQESYSEYNNKSLLQFDVYGCSFNYSFGLEMDAIIEVNLPNVAKINYNIYSGYNGLNVSIISNRGNQSIILPRYDNNNSIYFNPCDYIQSIQLSSRNYTFECLALDYIGFNDYVTAIDYIEVEYYPNNNRSLVLSTSDLPAESLKGNLVFNYCTSSNIVVAIDNQTITLTPNKNYVNQTIFLSKNTPVNITIYDIVPFSFWNVTFIPIEINNEPASETPFNVGISTFSYIIISFSIVCSYFIHKYKKH